MNRQEQLSRQEQLDAVVRNYVQWPSNGEVLFLWLPMGAHTFTREEVKQRKAELQNKPSWDDAPKGANILVFCPTKKGWIFGTFRNAEPCTDKYGWIGIGIGEWFLDDRFISYGEVIGDWRDTLEGRPKIDATLTDEGTKKDCIDSVGQTLAERQKRYGSFEAVEEVTEAMVFCLESLDGFKEARPDQREAAHMILQKLARAFSGDPDYIDNWHDIQGYAKLIEDRLASEQ